MATSMELPLLPFPLTEVLVPSESKTLHLYEARYLALLEESLTRKSKLFVHFVLDPIMINDSSAEPSFAARYGCLVVIENVEKLDVGALVSIRGVGRIKIVEFADPYLKGVVKPEQDVVPESLSRLNSKVTEIKEALHSLNSLEIKLKVSTLSLSLSLSLSLLVSAKCLLLCIF
ncbi:Lon protease [Trema orientale]|uniref:Lon protease n=1 Tax=Trema orientale TaxID=63057 RepID=A0A2P5FQT4_TREOI|nr:Lon protease [Trema orientale]